MKRESKRLKLHPNTPNLIDNFTEKTSSVYQLGTWGVKEAIEPNVNYKIIIRTSNVKNHDINAYVSNGTNNEPFSIPVTKISENLFIGTGKTSKVVEKPLNQINLYQFPNSNNETITIKDLKLYKEA